MRSQSASSKVHLIERRILCALCGGASADVDSMRELSNHRWAGAEHHIVFEAYAKMPPCDAKTLREMLPAQATRMGFPDVDWPLYFEPSEKSLAEIPALVLLLKKAPR